MSTIYKNILLPVDGSQQSIDAFKSGIQQAKNWNSSVYLVQVLSDDDDVNKIGDRESFLNALESYAKGQSVTLHKEIVFGDPRSQIARELVERWGIDLIVIGATGKGRIAKMLIGSVTTYVLRHALCDVLVCR